MKLSFRDTNEFSRRITVMINKYLIKISLLELAYSKKLCVCKRFFDNSNFFRTLHCIIKRSVCSVAKPLSKSAGQDVSSETTSRTSINLVSDVSDLTGFRMTVVEHMVLTECLERMP